MNYPPILYFDWAMISILLKNIMAGDVDVSGVAIEVDFIKICIVD